MKLIPTKQEQHGLASRWLHEIAEWEPPRFRRRKPPPQLEGQLEIGDAMTADEPAGNESGDAS